MNTASMEKSVSSAAQLLKELTALGIHLSLQGENIKFRAAKGLLTNELKVEIKKYKPELIQILAQQSDSIPKLGEQEGYELSHAQRRLWVFSQMEKDSTAYNVPFALLMEGEVDSKIFEQAFSGLIHRHEILRTTFTSVEGAPKQKVHSRDADYLKDAFINLDYSLESDADSLALEQAQRETTFQFDLEQGPLFRAVLIKLAPQKHVFLLTMHHIVTDGWSIRVLVEELSAFYKSSLDRLDNSLPHLEIQYKDYAAWQNQYLASASMHEHGKYWNQKLKGTEPLNLPLDNPRPAQQSFEGTEYSIAVGEEKLDLLKSKSKESRASLFMTIMAVVKTLLYRYTEQEDITVGIPMAGREHPQLQNQLGLYINTLALRDQLRGDYTFDEVLAQIKRTALEAYEHGAYPFDKLVDELELTRDLSRSPLFDVMVIHQDVSGSLMESDGLQFKPYPLPSKTSKYDLTFHFEEREGDLFLSIEYNTGLFAPERIEGMGEHFCQLISEINSAKKIGEMNLLSPEEQNKVLELSDAAPTSWEVNETVVELFQKQVEKTPEALALQFQDQSLTYAELNFESDKLTTLLQEKGVGPGQKVALCMNRSTNMVVGLLGILKSGGAYVPIDPEYPTDRISYMLEDSGAQIVLTDSSLAATLDQTLEQNDGVEHLCLDSEIYPESMGIQTSLETGLSDLAYVIYTSGSTGKPKGVQIGHKAFTNFLKSMADAPGISKEDRLLAVTTICFDIAGLEIFLPLISGAAIVLTSQKESANPGRLASMIEDENITMMQATPVTWRMLLEMGWKGSSNLKVLCGGEAMPSRLATQLLPRSQSLWNLYGPTETTVWSSIQQIEHTNDSDTNESSAETSVEKIGKPITNTQTYILNSSQQLNPIGVPGELYIGGLGLAEGYHNKQELTDKNFVYCEIPGQPIVRLVRLYKTGDRVQLGHDGVLDYHGRIDNQVKIRGFRIELGEIESALASHPNINEAVVVPISDGTAHTDLAAYIIPHSENDLDIEDLRLHLGHNLPEYMVPAFYVPVNEFPLTPNGKVDRKRLKAPESSLQKASNDFIAPQSDWEKQVAAVWSEVLSVSQVGMEDNFFELGGHSLKATRLVFRLQKELGMSLELVDVFKYPTLKQMVLLDQKSFTYETIPNVSTQEANEGYELSNAQKRLWVLNQMEEDDSVYNMPGSVKVHGKLDKEAFSKALTQVVNRHESLRTTFRSVKGTPRQFIQSKQESTLRYLDFTAFHDRDDKAHDVVFREASSSFDLEQGPLFRATLIKLEEDVHVFVFCLHHIVGDEWSLEIMVKDLLESYQQAASGGDFSTKTLPLQYKDYSAWQNKRLAEDANGDQKYWLNKFKDGVEVLNLPTDKSRPHVRTFEGTTLPIRLDSDSVQKLINVAEAQNTTDFRVLMALVKIMLFRYTEQNQITVGSPVSGREHPDLENQIGFYVNMLALQDDITAQDSFADVLSKVSQTITESFEHQAYPFDKLVGDLDLARDMSRTPLFDVLVVFDNKEDVLPSFGNLELSPFESGFQSAKFDLSFYFTKITNGIEAAINYRTDLYDAYRIQNMGQHLNQLVKEFVQDPKKAIGQVNILTTNETQQIISEFNGTRQGYGQRTTIIQLFEEQAQINPEATAVIFDNQGFSYGEINNKANTLAHKLLQNSNLQVGDKVAVLLERSDTVISTYLGILKAGMAYVPVDVLYPENRIEFILKNSGCRVVVTDSQHSVIDTLGLESIAPITSTKDSDSNNPVLDLTIDEQLENPAYVIYTSGSTGVPKGCVVTNRNLLRLMRNDHFDFDFNSDDVWIVSHSFCFDFSVWEMYGALVYGGKVVIAKNDDVKDPQRFRELLVQHKVSVLNQTPGAFYNLIEIENMAADHPLKDHLRYVIFGGDRLEASNLKPWLNWYSLNDIKLVNMYGITETTVHVTYHPVTEREILDSEGKSVVGIPLPETSVYICDSEMNLQPVGITGEIYVGGSGVSQGYLNRDELTAERFIQSPFNSGERLYKTGDLGSWRADGTLEHLGRNDDQVQIRGFRVELGEIETALLANEAIHKAHVTSRSENQGLLELWSYVVLTDSYAKDTDNSLDAIKEQLSRSLPSYMVPTQFIVLPEFPLTSNGKLDKKALLKHKAITTAATKGEPPATDWEKALALLWEEVLDVSDVSRQDHFFELGGHSLKAVQLISRIYQKHEKQLKVRDIFQHATLKEQALLLEGTSSQVLNRSQSITAIPEAEDYEISVFQRRLWVLHNMGANVAAYNIHSAVKITGHLEVESLKQALDNVVQRHESLRTTFFAKDEKPRQKIHSTVEGYFERVENSRGIDLQKAVEEDAAYAFDLEAGPLFKVRLYSEDSGTHVLSLTIHHIISDGWSLDVMLREVMSYYSSTPKTEDVEPLAIQYKDYAHWQKNKLESANNPDKEYWHGQFEGEIPKLELPEDKVRPKVQTFAGDMVHFELPESTAGLIRSFASDKKTSVFSVLMGLVRVLLHRYSGANDIVLGAPVSGRNHPELEQQIGFFVNMLALRDTIEGDDTLDSLVGRVGETLNSGMEHAEYPFDWLVDELEIDRDMGRSPLFDVAVTMQNSESGQDYGNLSLESFVTQNAVSKFDLTFYFSDSGSGDISCGIEYSTDLYYKRRIERMGGHFSKLASEALTSTDKAISKLELMPAAEKENVLCDFNDVKTDYPDEVGLVSVFKEIANTYPNNIAVKADKTLTYRELDEMSDKVALFLKEQAHIDHEKRVGLLFQRSHWMVVAALGVLKAGGAYVPLDPAYPTNRLEYIAKDAGVDWILSQEQFEPKIPNSEVKQFSLLDVEWNTFSGLEGNLVDNQATADSLAYIIYTSGSTGQPKGTLIEHRSILRLVRNTNYVNITPEDNIIQTGSLSFDASTFEIWGSLLNGATLCLPKEDVLLEAGELTSFMHENQVSVMFLTTSLFNQFVEAQIEMFRDLRVLLTGGEKVSVSHFNQLHDTYPSVGLSHVYGPTENTTFSSFFPVNKSYQEDVPIGGPIANSTLYILDPYGNPCPVGVPGEIYTGGDGVARGYLNQDELTAEKFIKDPFIKSKSFPKASDSLMYRSGDVGVWTEEGAISFVGRIDNQVKIRGFRVEPGEIERHFTAHEVVEQAIVIPKVTPVGTKELTAYVVLKEEQTSNSADQRLREYLSGILPGYMVPAIITVLEAMPLTVNGKIDRKALPEPDFSLLSEKQNYVAPQNDEQGLIAEVWESVLHRQPIGIHDDYFDLGGDSIKAIQITSRLSKKGYKLEVRHLFESPTILELAPLLVQVQGEKKANEIITGDVPLTAVQKWFFENHSGDIHHFNQAVLLESSSINREALKQTLSELVKQHDALRMTYPMSPEGTFEQQSQGLELGCSVQWHDLREDSEAEEKMLQYIEDSHTHFKLAEGPLVEAIVYQRKGKDYLQLVIHHLIVDGVSWRILLEDLEEGYSSYLKSGQIDLGYKTNSYCDWSTEMHEYSTHPNLLEETGYWSTVEEMEVKELPGTSSEASEATQTLGTEISKTETDDLLLKVPAAYHTETQDILLLALGRALHKWTGDNQTKITLEGHGREKMIQKLDVSRTVGWFTSLYPHCLGIKSDDISEQIKNTKEALRNIPNKGMGYGIWRFLNPDMQSKPLANWPKVSFNFLGDFDDTAENLQFKFAEESSGQAIASNVTRQHSLDVIAIITRDQLRFSLIFDKNSDETKMQELLNSIKEELLKLIEFCSNKETSEKTASDFNLAGLSEDSFDSLLEKL